MADLAELNRAEAVKVAGANNTTGIADNYMDVDVNGNAHVVATSAGPVTPGTAAAASNLIGGLFNDGTLPSLTTGQQAAIQIDINGRQLTVDAADGPVTPSTVATKSTLIGGQYNTTPPTLTNTQQAALQSNQFGFLVIAHRNNYRNLTGNATTTIKSGSGTLSGIMINNAGSSGTVTIYDNTAASGTIIATLTLPSGGVNPVPAAMTSLGIEFATGLTVVTAGSTANNFTFLWR